MGIGKEKKVSAFTLCRLKSRGFVIVSYMLQLLGQTGGAKVCCWAALLTYRSAETGSWSRTGVEKRFFVT